MTPPTSRDTALAPPTSPIALDDRRWQAMTSRTLDDLDPFVIAVTTTGIYCRVGCPARTPHRDNVRFFDSTGDASGPGTRPRKRCHPDAGDLSPWRSRRQMRGETHA